MAGVYTSQLAPTHASRSVGQRLVVADFAFSQPSVISPSLVASTISTIISTFAPHRTHRRTRSSPALRGVLCAAAEMPVNKAQCVLSSSRTACSAWQGKRAPHGSSATPFRAAACACPRQSTGRVGQIAVGFPRSSACRHTERVARPRRNGSRSRAPACARGKDRR